MNEFCVTKASVGEGTVIQPFVMIGREAQIGNDCTIAAYVSIGNDVKIGDDVRIQHAVFIPPGVTIEDNVFIGPHTCFTNVKYPRDPDHLPTLVCKGATIGANVTIVAGVTIGQGSTIGAGAVVTKDVPIGELWVGNPARKMRDL